MLLFCNMLLRFRVIALFLLLIIAFPPGNETVRTVFDHPDDELISLTSDTAVEFLFQSRLNPSRQKTQLPFLLLFCARPAAFSAVHVNGNDLVQSAGNAWPWLQLFRSTQLFPFHFFR
ncbi:hypothetical protein [uncultured Imperialibacter sp.]|uniref:hypothetical protein n=1 Tax=uncultured Imperialibacter sp. TaxID=1672639 RepID=UPI0030D983CC